ncbi:MAG: glycosyltransferase [Legionellaceae bacterium]|nr:glycosyltransferase [Legionellaceae bacterium]
MKAVIVVSCYNQQNYIADCLESILLQECDCEYSLLIADDASTDNTPHIIRSYQQRYPEKIDIILREKNCGPAENYIDAHRRAQGDIIFHIDGDDVMLPGKIQRQYQLFKRYPDVNLVFHRAQYFSDDGSRVSTTSAPRYPNQEYWFFDADDLATWGSITVHSAYAYRKSARKTIDPGREFMEWFFAMDALLPEGRAAYINSVLVKYRCNPQGSNYLGTRAGKIRSYRIYCDDVRYYAAHFPVLRKKLYANLVVTQLGMLRSRCGLQWKMLSYLFVHALDFRLSLVRQTLQVRRAAAPVVDA